MPAPAFKIFFLAASILAHSSVLQEVKGARFQLDLKYHSENNFLKKNVYSAFGLKQCWVLPELEEKLQKLVPLLSQERLKLILWDCYRPLAVQEAMWKLVPDPRYVADPKKGSNHNRGAAVDVALVNENGTLLEFPTAFDDFTPKASPKYVCEENEKEKCKNRDKLIQLMSSVGLEVFPTEWWHFQLPQASALPVIKTLESTK
ncbi:MAG: M15 family metallopeptidase [Pseudomonadota bacterium]